MKSSREKERNKQTPLNIQKHTVSVVLDTITKSNFSNLRIANL